jgi:hypothetical protein
VSTALTLTPIVLSAVSPAATQASRDMTLARALARAWWGCGGGKGACQSRSNPSQSRHDLSKGVGASVGLSGQGKRGSPRGPPRNGAGGPEMRSRGNRMCMCA